MLRSGLALRSCRMLRRCFAWWLSPALGRGSGSGLRRCWSNRGRGVLRSRFALRRLSAVLRGCGLCRRSTSFRNGLMLLLLLLTRLRSLALRHFLATNRSRLYRSCWPRHMNRSRRRSSPWLSPIRFTLRCGGPVGHLRRRHRPHIMFRLHRMILGQIGRTAMIHRRILRPI